jgi:hypothetical protein
MSDCPFCSGGNVSMPGNPGGSGGHSYSCPALGIASKLGEIADALEHLAEKQGQEEVDQS